ncbi:MAG: helix-turn-helix transcriptional regulator [bacterium]|nr:MAG: helix-turn-helix transcriptional regulator [bacterium]
MERERIGDRVKQFREIKRMSLEDLALRSGLEAEFLRSIENHEASPPIGYLLKISRALGIRMANFLDDQIGADPIISRAAERSGKDETHMEKGVSTPDSMVYYSLGTGKLDRHMEPFFIEINPVPAGQVKVSTHEGEEFIAVLSGTIEVQYGSETFILGPGDSLYYSSNVPHRVIAAGNKRAEIYAVLYFNV